MGEGDAAEEAAVKAAVKAAEHVVVNHELLKEVVQHLVYVGVLGVQKVAVTVVNVLAKLVKANQNPNQNQDPNQDPNQYQEQIKS